MASLTDLFSKVQLENETDGVVVLQSMLEAAYDRSPALVTALQTAIAGIGATPPPQNGGTRTTTRTA